jgi:t-SNARE complex subunit (syntaxin)
LTIECLDNIESNISLVEGDTYGAAEELSTAAEYQRKAGRRAACLMIVLVVVVAVVLLAVRATLSNGVDVLTARYYRDDTV